MITSHICVVLDESGSMGAVRKTALDGLNSYLRTLRADREPGERVLTTLVSFNSLGIRTRFAAVPLQETADVPLPEYRPDARTPLYDSLFRAIRATEDRVANGDRALVVVVTDGLENASAEITLPAIRGLIDEKRRSGAWTFAYIGAHEDVWAAAGGLGFDARNTIATTADRKGIDEAWELAARGTKKYLRAGHRQSREFFTESGDEAGHKGDGRGSDRR